VPQLSGSGPPDASDRSQCLNPSDTEHHPTLRPCPASYLMILLSARFRHFRHHQVAKTSTTHLCITMIDDWRRRMARTSPGSGRRVLIGCGEGRRARRHLARQRRHRAGFRDGGHGARGVLRAVVRPLPRPEGPRQGYLSMESSAGETPSHGCCAIARAPRAGRTGDVARPRAHHLARCAWRTRTVSGRRRSAQDGHSAGRPIWTRMPAGARVAGELTHAREFAAATLTLGSRCSTVRNGAWPLRALRLRRVCERVSTRFRADPENVDNVRFGLAPHNPPG
jgi:hypothetical protein